MAKRIESMTHRFEHIGIVGGGAWGTALAAAARRAGRSVTLWARAHEVVRDINHAGMNAAFLPDIVLPAGIRATTDLGDLAAADAVLLVVPSQFLRAVVRDLAPHVPPSIPMLICAKGVEAGTGALMSEVVRQEMPTNPIGVLSGPTFAAEVARGLPTAVTLAMEDAADAAHRPQRSVPAALALALSTPGFRPYLADDVVGAEIGGAVKNVIAIAAGIASGRALGANAHAALITRGLAEISRLGAALGGRAETLMGLSGLGDLTLTCSNEQSRNMSFGIRLGRGEAMADILASRRAVVEGVANAASISALARDNDVDMPITFAVDAILHRGADVGETVEDLLDRPLRAEADGLRDRIRLPRPNAA